MGVQRNDIERALNEIISQEAGMRFQGLAAVLGKMRWPELVANPRKKDGGLDAYAGASWTPEKVGKGLAASITTEPETKVPSDAKTAKTNYPDLRKLLFVTPHKVGRAGRNRLEKKLRDDHDIDLLLIEREDIIIEMMIPKNAKLCASFLYLTVDAEPDVTDLIDRTRRAAAAVTQNWAGKTKGRPLIELTAARLEATKGESPEALSLTQIDEAISRSNRVVLEGSAGSGKTTTLIQIAQRPRLVGIPFIVELSSWSTSGRYILEYIAGMPAFQQEGITAAALARVQQTQPLLFLLNGWNEIAASNSAQANDALRDLERAFPSAGIVVATRTHHLIPPLPGALRLRLLRLRSRQRADYLAARLGEKSSALCARIDADPSLEALTRTPLILSEVASLFEADAEIPSTKFGVLARVLRLHEQRDEHQNALQAAPLYGRYRDYLKALATAMTRRGAVALPEAEACAVVGGIVRELTDRGQVGQTAAPTILAGLTAHHVLERVEYPETAFQFEHQQVQEYYATLDIRAHLFELADDDHEAINRFTADCVNSPTWAEPLRMIAETLAEPTGDDETEKRNIHAGVALVKMALVVDLVFAGELVQLCGAAVWNDVRALVGERFRAVYADPDANYRRYAVAAMLATGANDFRDVIVPLLSGPNQQTRLRTHRLWPDIHLSSLGPDWRDEVRSWSEAARREFVFELLGHRVDEEIASFAADDDSVAVKKAAVSSLMWAGSDSALTRVLESMDARTFEEVARNHADEMPPALKPKAVAVIRGIIDRATNDTARLGAALNLLNWDEAVPEGGLKNAMSALSDDDLRNLYPQSMRPALEHLGDIDPAWVNRWVATRVAESRLRWEEAWLPFVSAIPQDLVETCLHRLETENLSRSYIEGMIVVLTAQADATLTARVFAKLRESQRKVDATPEEKHEVERHVTKQLRTLLHRLPGDLVVEGILSSVKTSDLLDIKVVADLLSRTAYPDVERLRVADDDLKARLRTYLKGSVDLVLSLDDFNGDQKAALASSIALVGTADDMADLTPLLHADIERVRRGRAARAAGDRGPLGNSGIMSNAHRYVSAILDLDPVGADQVLIDLLSEPEYVSQVAGAMARDFVPTPSNSFIQTFRYDLIWAARKSGNEPRGDDQRRTRFTAALHAEIKGLPDRIADGEPALGLQDLASALAAVDGRGSSVTVQDAIAMHGPGEEYTCAEATRRLLTAGAVVSANTVFSLVTSIVKRLEKWSHEPDRQLLASVLALCPYVDDPTAGVAKIRNVLATTPLRGDEMDELVIALGECRADAAIDLLCDLASDVQTSRRCEDGLINAIAAFDTQKARTFLMGFVDPTVQVIAPTPPRHRDDLQVARLAELAQRRPEDAGRLTTLCGQDLPKINREILSKVLDRLGTPEALFANLTLIDDARSSPIPQGLWEQLNGIFVERIRHDQDPNISTLHARASNDLRARLFQMACEDEKRRKAARALLGHIEVWRLEYGRPTDEPRHPALTSNCAWPPSAH